MSVTHHQQKDNLVVPQHRQTLLNWLQLFRAECQSLHIFLRGGLRDNALRNTIFHKQGMICCRLLGLWYRSYKKEICFHFIQNIETYRKRKRMMKNAEKRKRRKEKKPRKEKSELEQTSITPSQLEKSNHQAKRKKKAKVETQTKEKSKRTLATKKRFRGGELFIRSRAELKLRKRILTEIIKCGWAISAEMYMMRANTSTVCMGMMAALSRMHLLLSSKSSSSNDGRFGSWLLV